MLGILVDGDNHFIVAGPRPERGTALALARQWGVIQIGGAAPITGWEICTKAFREDLEWAVVVPASRPQSDAVAQLLAEMAARGIGIDQI